MAENSSDTCSVEDCNRLILNKKRRLCQMHYTRFMRHGDPTIHLYSARMSPDRKWRLCPRCQTWKAVRDFYKNAAHRGCRECICAANREKWATEPEGMRQARRRHLLKKKYGITLEEYDAMLEAQGGVCALCGSPPPEGKVLAVDHCHNSQRVRGLLCSHCNISLERVEIPGWAEAALKYVAT